MVQQQTAVNANPICISPLFGPLGMNDLSAIPTVAQKTVMTTQVTIPIVSDVLNTQIDHFDNMVLDS